MFIKKRSGKTQEPESVEHGYNYAVFLLGLKLRTEGEIREKMQGRGYSLVVIDSVVERLLGQKYINDKQYAEVLLENLKTYKLLGFFGIKKKMMEKRLSEAIISQTMEENLPIVDELAIAKKYMGKEHLKLDDGLEYEERQKIAARLHRRGFRSEVITKIFSGQVPEIE